MRYRECVVVVTGGTQGIGEGIVRAFRREGARVWAASPDAAAGAALEAGLAAGPGACRFVRCDVTREADIAAALETVIVTDGRLDCLINNAGTHPPHQPIDAFSAADFRALLELNLVSVFNACRLALPHLRQTRGVIVNIASLVGSIGQEGGATYVATKGGVIALTKALAVDEARHGVRVNSVSPGNIGTPLWHSFAERSADPSAFVAAAEATQWLPRLGTPDEVGRLCVYLAAEATFTTGVDHVISGGAELAYGRKPPDAATS